MIQKSQEFRYSNRSKKELESCNNDIQKVFNRVIELTVIDITVVCGLRTDKEQSKMYAKGRTAPGKVITNCDGIKKRSKHQSNENGKSDAIDISIYSSDSKYSSEVRYDELHLAYIAGVVDAVSLEMFENGEISNKLIWGGNWDRDGVLSYDQRLQDLCHWESE